MSGTKSLKDAKSVQAFLWDAQDQELCVCQYVAPELLCQIPKLVQASVWILGLDNIDKGPPIQLHYPASSRLHSRHRTRYQSNWFPKVPRIALGGDFETNLPGHQTRPKK